MVDWARMIEAVSKTRIFMITRDGRLGWYFLIDGRMGKDSVIEAVSTIRILTSILVWDSVDQY